MFVQEDRAIATTTTRKSAAAAAGSKPKAASKSKTASQKTGAKKPAAASKTKTAKTTSATKKTAPARKTGMTKVTEAAAKAAAKLPATKPKSAKKTAAPKAAAQKAGAKPAPKKSTIPPAVLKLHQAILKSLDDDKAENIVSIDLTGKSSIADFLVVASGRSSRQVAAIAEHLVERVTRETGRKVRAEGKAVGDWVLIDTGDIVVHIFRPEVRSFYNLEKMWGGATIPEPAAA